MTKLDKIKKLRESWQKTKKRDIKNNLFELAVYAGHIVYGLTLAIETIENHDRQECDCPQGSICEFFEQDEKCRYGKI